MRKGNGRMIDGQTRTCGVIGNPIKHTISPLIHNTLAGRFGHNLVYVPFAVEDGGLEAAIKGAYALDILGMNVTVPYKGEVIKYLTDADPLAARIGAVNTLVRAGGGYKGFNTDMSGLKRAMSSEGISMEGEEIILLGAGGAARAVAYLCAEQKARKVYILNRTIEKAQAVSAEINEAFGREVSLPLLLSDHAKLPDRRYLAIQATSVGLEPHDEEVVIEDEAFYKKVHTGYDLIYKPFNTRFMKLVRQAGGRAYNGLKMLIYQGIDAYELWNDVKISTDDADYVFDVVKREMGL